MLLADGDRVPIVLLPEALLEDARAIVRSTFSSLVKKRVYTLQCSRAAEAEPHYVQTLSDALARKGVVMTTPSSMKSIILKFIEALVRARRPLPRARLVNSIDDP